MARANCLAIAAVLLIALHQSVSFSPTHHVTTTSTNNIFTSSTSALVKETATSIQLFPGNQQEEAEKKITIQGNHRSLLKKSKPVALTVFTIISSFFANVSPSFASAPVTPIRQFKPQDQKKIALDKMKLEQSKMQMQEQMEHQLKCEEIEETDGKAAREAYEKEYEQRKIQEGETRILKKKELLYGLVQQGICPFMDLEGERQVYEFDNGIDLAKVPTTPQQKEFMNLRRNPKLVERRLQERFIIKCIVDDLIAKGEDPLEFLQNNKDRTMEIFGMSEKKLDAVAARYKGIIESQGTLSGVVSETPFDVAAAIGVLPSQGAADVKASKAAAKLEAAKLKAQQKAEKKAAKEAAKAESLRLKAEKKAEKEAVKAEAALLKAEAKAEADRLKAEAKAEADRLKTEVSETGEVDVGTESEEGLSSIVADEASLIRNENDISSSDDDTAEASLPIVPIAGVMGVAGGGIVLKNIKDKNAAAEEERQKQFRLIMGLDNDGNEDDDDDGDEEDDFFNSEASLKVTAESPKPLPLPKSTPVEPPKKRRKGLASVFSKRGSNRETDLNNLIAPGATAPEFSALLAKLLSFGAPGRFPLIKGLAGGMPMDDFKLDEAKKLLIESRASNSISDEVSAEAFACVVNCMIIDIIDLASSSLGEEKKNTVTVDALNVVMDFMDHAASLFDAVADGVVITPVTYGGNLAKSKLEKMFTIYASSLMTSLDGKVTQDRIDTLQQVFNINDKRAEGLIQKGMMKNLMNMMKNPEAMGDMGGMEGMEGLSEMMAAMGGADGGLPGFDPNGEISPEELKQSVAMMKELVNSGSVSKEELDLVRQQFQEVYGSDINDLIKAADEGGEDELGEDGKELLDLFKTILKED